MGFRRLPQGSGGGHAGGATQQWHTLKVRITGKKVEGFLDDKLLFEYELPEDVSSRSVVVEG